MAGSENGGNKKKPQSRGRLQTLLNLDDSKYDFLSLGTRNFVSEMFGTGLLVFLGCMGCVKGLGQPGDHTGVAMSFALAVFLSIQICCHNSGGHVNPALTVVSIFFKRLTIPMAVIYILGQCTGGILGFGLLKLITPSNFTNTGYEEHGLCTTVPNKELSIFQALLTEFILTTVLMLIVCSAWDPRNDHLHDSVTLKFGFAIFSLAYAGVSYSGCSMNPARSLGPAVWNNSWKHHWIYWVGPFLGGIFSGYIYTTFFCAPLKRTVSPKETKPLEMETVSTVTS